MNVYKGYNRRQVGGGVWSTISRGIRPFLKTIIEKIKPHAKEIGKSVAKRAAKSALNITSTLAGDALLGKMNKENIKTAFVDEVHKLKNDADQVIAGYKRKYLDNDDQSGKGAKRRKVEMKTKKIKGYKQKKGNNKKMVYKQKQKVQKKRKLNKRKSKINIDIFGK